MASAGPALPFDYATHYRLGGLSRPEDYWLEPLKRFSPGGPVFMRNRPNCGVLSHVPHRRKLLAGQLFPTQLAQSRWRPARGLRTRKHLASFLPMQREIFGTDSRGGN